MLRPERLPRPLSVIVVAVVYCPPWYSSDLMRQLNLYINHCLDWVSCTYPNAGIFVAGDFNSFQTGSLCRNHRLRQVVRDATRGKATLDKILTNCAEYYLESRILPPIGNSDHNCVYFEACYTRSSTAGYKHVSKRYFSTETYECIAKDLLRTNWSIMYRENDCRLQADMLYSIVSDVVDKYAPVRSFVLRNNDKPWIGSSRN